MLNDAERAAILMERIGRLARTEEQIGDLYPAQWAALRYLARANRFSRNPMAITKYLATTRGTTSQTIIALERKGYVARHPSENDRRSVNVELTRSGRDKLKTDPLHGLEVDMQAALRENTAELSRLLEALLTEIIKSRGGQQFGQCHTCRYFEIDGGSNNRQPHRCELLNAGLSDSDSKHICVEQETGAAGA